MELVENKKEPWFKTLERSAEEFTREYVAEKKRKGIDIGSSMGLGELVARADDYATKQIELSDSIPCLMVTTSITLGVLDGLGWPREEPSWTTKEALHVAVQAASYALHTLHDDTDYTTVPTLEED